MTDLEIARGVRALIGDPARWCQEHLALDKANKPIRATASAACRWCLDGAILKVLREQPMSCIRLFRDLLSRRAGEETVTFNDTHTHSDVIGLLSSVIADLEKEHAKDAI